MSRVGKDIEKMIVRRLDGALSEAEALELDREIIRNPDARRLMEEYGRIDDLAAAALQAVVTESSSAIDVAALPDRIPASPRRARFWNRGLAVGAIAAALLGVIVARFPFAPGPAPKTPLAQRSGPEPIPRVVASPRHPNAREALLHNANGSSRSIVGPMLRRNTGREIFGVVGENGNIYWIEVERTRTFRRPKRRSTQEM